MRVWTSRMLAVSLAGHDKGKLYVVVEEVPAGGAGCTDAGKTTLLSNKETDSKNSESLSVTEGTYLFLADGKSRTLEHPKRKKVKHMQLITHLPQSLLKKMSEITLDAHVRKILREYSK